MRDKDNVVNYLRDQGFHNISYIDHFSGESNHTHIFKENGKKYVLRTNLDEKGSTNRLQQEHKILKFLESQNIDFVPKSINYDREKQIHITSHIGRRDVKIADLNSKQLQTWIEHLAKIHSLDFKDYREFCEKHSYSYKEPETRKQSIQKFGFERLDYTKQHLETNILEWAEENLEEVYQNVGNTDSDTIGLSHGDIANNTRITENKVYFIDWELARFSYRPEGTLSYTYIHEDLDEDLYRRIKQLYRKKTGVKNLEEELEATEKITRIHDVIWSLRRVAKLKQKDDPQWKEYMELARERKSSFQDRFKK